MPRKFIQMKEEYLNAVRIKKEYHLKLVKPTCETSEFNEIVNQ